MDFINLKNDASILDQIENQLDVNQLNSIFQQKKKYISRACVHCKNSHVACDHQRPCSRCVRLGKMDCVDAVQKKRGRPPSKVSKKSASQSLSNYRPILPAVQQQDDVMSAMTALSMLFPLVPDLFQQQK